jgi:hypothetical protein
MSGFGSKNLNKVSDYDEKLTTEPKSQWQCFFGGLFQKISKIETNMLKTNMLPKSIL